MIDTYKLWLIRADGGRHIKVVRYFGGLLTGLLFDRICGLIASLDFPKGLNPSIWYSVWFWTGHLFGSGALWLLTLYLFDLLPKRFQED